MAMDSSRLIYGREFKHGAMESRNALCHALSLFTIAETNIHKLFLVLVDKGREDPITTNSAPSSDHQRNAIKWRFAGTQMLA